MLRELCTLRLGAVLDVVGDVEQLAQLRAEPAGHIGLDPVAIDIASSSRPRWVDRL